MKFEEFKRIVEERQKLLKKKEQVNINKVDIESKLKNIDYRLFGNLEFSGMKMNKIFYIETENVQKFLEEFFETEDNVEIGFSGINLEFELVVKNKLYRLGNYDYNQTLKCLYFVVCQGWEELLKDYPDLKDFLWDKFKEFKTVKKRNELTLIQRKLNKKNEELEFLQNPESVQERIRVLKTEKKKIEAQIKTISEDIEEVNFE